MESSTLSFDDLVINGVAYLEKIGRSNSLISKYRWTWQQIQSFMSTSAYKSISVGVSEFLKQKYGSKQIGELRKYEKDCMRQALCLAQFSESGEMPEQIEFIARPTLDLSGKIGAKMIEYIVYKRSLRLCEKTLRSYQHYLSELNKYLLNNHVDEIPRLSPLIMMHYVSTLLPEELGAKHLALSIIRSFLEYLYSKDYTTRNLSIVIPRDNYKSFAHLPSVYTKEEIFSILNTADQSTNTGKRDYAILLLAIRLGLRAADIRGLTYQNINWPASLLNFIQQKTRNRMELPLPKDVGEAIINYLRSGRPASQSNYIFVDHNYPYSGMSDKAIPRIASNAIRKSGIMVGERKHGSHVLRHTLANFLLEQGTALPIISEILGHETVQTSMCYLRIDVEQLRQCALEVPQIPDLFYKQQKGAFYEI
jgi:site-specific recombinase XerD